MPTTRAAVSAYLRACQAASLSPRTLRQYRWALGHLPLKLPRTPAGLEHVLNRRTWNGTSRLAVYRCLSAFYHWAQARYGLTSPLSAVKRPRPARREAPHFDELQLRLLWGQCQGDRDRAMLRFMLDSGARLGEAASLRAWDIRAGLVRVSGKTGDRQVVISADTADALRRAANGGAVFPGQRGPLTASGLYQAFRRLVARARLAGWRMGPHAVRHTFATLFLKAGGSVLALQRLLGHSRLEQSARYIHLSAMELLGHGLPSVAGRVLPGSPLRGAA